MSFNGTDIRRALEAAGPTPAQLKDLTDKLAAAQDAPAGPSWPWPCAPPWR